MGYLDNTTVVVDAILTKKGREMMARGDGSFNITQFALSDDEIDYGLWNPNHPNGSAFSGEAIENMPVIEAFPDENQIMRNKLVTLPEEFKELLVNKEDRFFYYHLGINPVSTLRALPSVT